MGAYTANYMLYLCAVGERGWGDRVNENFEVIDAELKNHTDTIDDHIQSHDTITGKMQMKTDLLVPTPHSIFGKVVTDYTITPNSNSIALALPGTISSNLAGSYDGILQILQLPFFQTMSGTLKFHIRANVTPFTLTLICIDQNMNTLSTTSITSSTWQSVTIPKKTAGIYARSSRDDLLYMSGYAINVTS